MPAMMVETTEIPQGILERLRHHLGEMKMLPGIAMQALRAAERPDCTIGEFSAVVERDIKLASDILSMANSVMFSSGQPVSSLHQAVVRLGFRPCKNLILASSLSSLMKKMAFAEEQVREVLSRHSFLAAMASLHLNRAVHLGFQGEEFTAGLIHDVGRTLMAVCFPEQFAQIDPLSFDESPDTLLHEQALTGTDHCRLGGWFAAVNNLPEPLVAAVRFHHEPAHAGEYLKLTALTASADQIANHLQRRGPEAPYDPDSNRSLALLETCGVKHARERFRQVHETLLLAAWSDANRTEW